MTDILKEKQFYETWIISVLPLLAVSSTLKNGIIISVITALALLLSSLGVFALKSFLTEKTASFARLLISVVVVGIASVILRIPFNTEISELGIYVGLSALSAVLMLRSDFVINTDVKSIFLGCGISSAVGFGLVILSSLLREFLGLGSIFGIDIYTKYFTPIAFLATPAGGLLVAAILTILYQLFISNLKEKEVA